MKKQAEIYYFLGHEQFQPEQLLEDAIVAEKVGFDGLFVSEHFNPWVADMGASGFALTTLGAIAARTKKIKLMTGVISPLFRYHPAVIAQAAATIDRLSNGRFTLGIGTGESINETPLGFNFPAYKERSERLIEAVEIIEKLLNGEKINYKGKYYRSENVKLYSPPVTKVPIFISANGPKSASIAAQYSDGIIVSVKNEEESLQRVVNPFKVEAKVKNKQKAKIIATRWSVFAKNTDEAYKALKPWRGLRAPDRDLANDPANLQLAADNLNRQDIVERFTVINKIEDYIKDYSTLITKLNADMVVIQTTSISHQQELIKNLGKTVIPELKNL